MSCVRDGAVGAPLGDGAGRLGDPGEADGHDGVGGERTAGWVHVNVVAEAERLAEQPLLVGERGAHLGDVDAPAVHAGVGARLAGRERFGQVAHPGLVRLDPVVDAPDPHRLARPAVAPCWRSRGPPREAPSEIGGRSCVRSGAVT